MIIIDILIAAYFFYVRKIAKKGISDKQMLSASTFGASLLSTLIIFFVLAYTYHFINIKVIKITPIMGTFSIILIALITNRIVDRLYEDRINIVVNITNSFPRVLLYIIPIIHWMLSVFLLFSSYRLLN